MKQILKKIIAAVICGSLLLSLAACGGNKNTSNNISNSNNSNITTSNDIETKEYNAYKSNGKIVDLLTVEEVNINPFTVATVDNAEFFQWRMKVRNTSGKDLVKDTTSMRIWYNYLDENKDIIYNHYLTGGYQSTIANDRAEWIEENGWPGSWTKNELESVAYIEIYGYTMTLSTGAPEYEFSTPILIDVRNYKKAANS